jgi:hypothetical protein
MLLMALVNYFMTGPTLNLWLSFKNKKGIDIWTIEEKKYRILISFGNNERGSLYFDYS